MTSTLWAKFAFVLQSISQLPSGMVGGADDPGAERATSLPIALPKERERERDRETESERASERAREGGREGGRECESERDRGSRQTKNETESAQGFWICWSFTASTTGTGSPQREGVSGATASGSQRPAEPAQPPGGKAKGGNGGKSSKGKGKSKGKN